MKNYRKKCNKKTKTIQLIFNVNLIETKMTIALK